MGSLDAPPSTVRWCLGLQSTGLRPLTPSETGWLQQHSRVVLGRLLRLLVPVVGIPLALYGFVRLLGHGPDTETPLYTLVPGLLLLFAGGFILPATAILMARDVLGAWRAVRADLAAGTVEQFQARQTEGPADAAIAGESTRIESIDVVPCSNHVLLVNGKPPERPLTARIYESAPPPDKVALYSLPAAIAAQLPEGAEGGGRIDRRRLTTEEVVELTTLARRLRRSSWVLLTIQAWVAAIGTAGVAGVLEEEKWPVQWPSAALFTILMVSGIIGLRRMVHRWRLSRIIDEDRRDAWVLVLHGQSSGPSPIEVLPRSQLLWSSASAPGAWRMTAVQGRPVSPPTA